ncbi:transglutaminase family protein [Hymenobacter crusticola]|uniref:Transglutaminase n=1 Tax=Hymenobacter crusticola TaxID=1770526 RepID=A0A243WDD6_9BACT|nr:transglutaminase family protein [Hymenobacter crusticola]OUJ73675.1 transglutaminase [Hymenobacter crusticola]
MPSYNIKHITRYSYASPVIDCTNQIMVYPLEDIHLEVKRHEINVSHHPIIETYTDYFGNTIGVFTVIQPHTELVIESVADIVTQPIQFPMDEQSAEEQWQQLTAVKDDVEYMDFLTQERNTSYDTIKNTLSALINYSDKPLKNALVLSEYVFDNFAYKTGVTNIETPVEEIWELKAGVCQDFAHLLLFMLRTFGFPARYVSGYICPKTEGVRGEGATHAWVEVYIPFYGWLGLDPTNNCIVNDGHVRIAVGRNFSDCTPVKGTYKGTGAHKLEVSVHIENGTPRNLEKVPTQPTYTFEVKDPEVPVNSYRRFLEMQQQQQQQ